MRLLAKWFARVLNPEGPPWCALARSLLTRQLATTRRTLSDLLAGDVSPWQLRGVSRFWYRLLRAWDALDGGADTQAEVPHNIALATSASLVFVQQESGRPIKASRTWQRRGIRQASDLVVWQPEQSALQVIDTRSNTHTRLRRRFAEGQIKLTPLFERVRQGASDQSSELEALWRLARLAGGPLREYSPKAGGQHQQQRVEAATSPYAYQTPPVSVWSSINRKTLMPKLRSLAWTIHAGGYRTATYYAKFTNASPQCPRCDQAAEKVER